MDSVSTSDRGFCYGDGLFETVLFVDGDAPLWQRHMQRLRHGCERLGLPAPQTQLLRMEAARLAQQWSRAVVRITLSRGQGPRGYRPPPVPHPTRVLGVASAPHLPRDWSTQGIRVRFCRMRLAVQPQLAGLKHLNRLEQVLARAEWSDAEVAEGVMRDTAGRVVCATSANLFVVRQGRVVTPSLQRCGVAGVARAELIEHMADVDVRDISVDELMEADEMFLSNSVRGVMPVAWLDNRRLAAPGETTRACMAHWQALGLAADTRA